MTRIGVVRYLNTLPLIEGLEKLPDLQLLPDAPARLAPALRRGDTDLALVSVVDALGPQEGCRGPSESSSEGHAIQGSPAHDPTGSPTQRPARQPSPDQTPEPDLTLLPVGMIGCDGPTLTVRLVSRVPFDRVSTVTADDESHTSLALCRIVLRELPGRDPEIRPRKVAEWLDDADARRSVETALLIGDKVVNAPPLDDFPYQLDLGEQWNRLTSLPFVYAMWACRTGEEASEPIRLAASLLDRQLRRNSLRLPWLVETRAPGFGWSASLARRYVCELLRFSVDQRALEGLHAFAAHCRALGLGTAPRLAYEWVEQPGHITR